MNMQEQEIDSRSFPEIWASLTRGERNDLTIEIYKARCCSSYQTICNWAHGRQKPKPVISKEVASVVSRFLKKRILRGTLFPES